jgi:hypothetical protein
MDEEYITLEYCSKCRDYHEVTEDMGTWLCPRNGKRPVVGATEDKKALDEAIRILKEQGELK